MLPSRGFTDNLLKQAHTLHLSGALDEAEKIYLELLNHDYSHHGATFLLASLFSQRGKNGLAIILLKHLLAEGYSSPELLNNLAQALQFENKRDEALRYYHAALEAMPPGAAGERAEILGNLAGLFVQNGTPQQASEHAEAALRLKPECGIARWHAALAALESGKFEPGFRDYEAGFAIRERSRKAYRIDGRALAEWDGRSKGTSIVVQGEQSIGDEIMFSSLLSELTPYFEHIVMDCHPQLAALMASHPVKPLCYPYRLSSETSFLERSQPAPEFRINAASLCKFFRKRPEDFSRVHTPYLHADPVLAAGIRERLTSTPRKLKVGITWQGGRKKTGTAWRSTPLADWEPILKQDCLFFSLNYAARKEDLDRIEQSTGVKVEHWQDVLDDFSLTAALVGSMDLVISVCTTVVHLCGAMGQKCWVLTPVKVDWRYGLASERMLWYPHIRLFRQDRPGDWREPIGRAASELAAISQQIEK